MKSNGVIVAHYLDSSVLIKLLLDTSEEEPGRTAIRSFFNENSGFYTTSHCFAETLNILKRKCYFEKNKKRFVFGKI